MNVNVDAAEMLFQHIFCICYILSCLDCKVLVQLFFSLTEQSEWKAFFFLIMLVFILVQRCLFLLEERLLCVHAFSLTVKEHMWKKNDSSCHSCRNFQCKRIMF